MNPLQLLQARLTSLVRSKEAFAKHMTQEEIAEHIDMLIGYHRNVIASLDAYASSPTNMSRMAERIKAIKKPKEYNLDKYINFRKRLQNNVQAEEIRKPMSSLYAANEAYIEIMTQLRDSIPEFFENGQINVFNLKLSHVIILGLLYQSEMLGRYSSYTLVLLTNAVRGEKDYPKYRVAFLSEKAQLVAKLINATYNKSGAHNLKGMIKQIRRNANDLLLLDDKNSPQVTKAATPEKEVGKMLESGVDGFNIFVALGQAKNTRKKIRRDRALRDLEWLRSHTAVLLHELGDIEKDSPEYKKALETIEYYETEIRKLERKLQV